MCIVEQNIHSLATCLRGGLTSFTGYRALFSYCVNLGGHVGQLFGVRRVIRKGECALEHDLIYKVLLGGSGGDAFCSLAFSSFFCGTLDSCFLFILSTGHANLILIKSVMGCQVCWKHERGLMVWDKKNGRKKRLFWVETKPILNQLCEELEQFKELVNQKLYNTTRRELSWCWSVGKLHLSCSSNSSPPNNTSCALQRLESDSPYCGFQNEPLLPFWFLSAQNPQMQCR